jgi:hypothetical protein
VSTCIIHSVGCWDIDWKVEVLLCKYWWINNARLVEFWNNMYILSATSLALFPIFYWIWFWWRWSPLLSHCNT